MHVVRINIAVAFALLLTSVSVAKAQDSIRLVEGQAITGTIKSVSPTEITYKRGGGATDKALVNQVASVQFNSEPPQLRQARTNVANGGYESALTQLGKIELDKVTRDEIKQDVKYFTAVCKARLALGGLGEINDAGKLVFDFIKEHPQSFHFYDSNELLGDLLVAAGKFDDAQKYYAKVAEAPWPEFQMRANVRLGRALAMQNKPDAAIAEFDKVIATAGSTPSGAMKIQQQSATLGKAAALAKSQKAEEGAKLAQSVIDDPKANAEDTEIMANAYVTLGNCYRAMNKSKPALFAFLYVDLLYNTNPQVHAEALANLVALFTEDSKPERAAQAKKTLMERYANSPWAKQAGA